MIKTGTPEAGLVNRRFFDMDAQTDTDNQGHAWRTEIIEGNRESHTGPQAFLIEQGPNSVAAVHFHTEDQFQVIVAGGGTLGRHAVGPYVVHYACGHTGYGPITAGEAGLSYLTLRAVPDFAPPYYLPRMRSHMKPVPKVNRSSKQVPAAADTERSGRKDVACDELIAPMDTGVAAWMLRVPPHHVASLPHVEGGGQFRVVLAGSMTVGDEHLAHLGCAFVDAPERALPVTAGADGLDVLVLQFPSRSGV